MENEIKYNHELSILDDKLIAFLELEDSDVGEITMTIKYEIDFEGINSRYERTTDYNIYSILTPFDDNMVEIMDLLDEHSVKWLETQISEGSLD